MQHTDQYFNTKQCISRLGSYATGIASPSFKWCETLPPDKPQSRCRCWEVRAHRVPPPDFLHRLTTPTLENAATRCLREPKSQTIFHRFPNRRSDCLTTAPGSRSKPEEGSH
ncbi:hypothetical protein F2Q69_00026290 [Brassica cretica]|uniref:Uncharacterized protein n=1 Tax=Brassica cretica TaxID=69181 RepID=A0A8S9S2X1_BRACR|nr:hypothetical protein F2Q69_00026290 [Brassica cretica]